MILICGRRMGAAAMSYEVEDDSKFQDILGGIGFAYGLALTLRLYRCAAHLQSWGPCWEGKHCLMNLTHLGWNDLGSPGLLYMGMGQSAPWPNWYVRACVRVCKCV